MKRLPLNAAWHWAIGVFLVARIFYTLWGVIVLLLIPIILQNLNLFGVPVVAYFDLTSSERYVYAREVNGRVLTFRAGNIGTIIDNETYSIWSLRDARAISGEYAGTKLEDARYTAEDVFPYRGVAPAQSSLLAIWQRFDTNWYLKIAQRGYSADDGSTVYFPLYPFLIRAVGTILFGNDLLAAILISNVALLVSLYLLYEFTRQVYDDGAAKRALIYLVIFPTAFFFLAAYTESLFFMLAIASLYAARKNNFFWASVLGALAALTRLQGLLLIIPLAYLFWTRRVSGGDTLLRTCTSARQRVINIFQNVLRAFPIFVPLLLIPLATFGFLLFTNLSLVASYEGELHARFVTPWENLWASMALTWNGGASIADLANLGATILFGAMCVIVWKKISRELAIYAALMFLAPVFRMTTTQPLVSMTRYILVMFPVFMLWGAWGKYVWVNRAVVYLSIPLSLYFSAQFWLWGWVA